MANVMLNDKTFRAGSPAVDGGNVAAAAAAGSADLGMAAGTGTAARPGEAVMTVNGTIVRAALLVVIALCTGSVGWAYAPVVLAPGAWLVFLVVWVALIGMSFWAARNPRMAVVVGPLYAVVAGVWAGAISRVFEAAYQGVVTQAVLATLAVLAVTLALYTLRIVRVTNRFVQVVVAATLGVLLLYVGAFVASLFGFNLFTPSPLGIAISVLTSGVAAFNLFLDFHFIEMGVTAGAPAYMEWYCAFGLLATIIWLYLELLRLLSFIRR